MYSPNETSEPRSRYEEMSLGSLLRDLTHETTELVRKEVELAKAETRESVSRIRAGLTSLLVGGAIAFGGFLFLLTAAAFFIEQWIQEPWLSTIIVAGAALILGLIIAAVGRNRLKSAELAPKRTAASLRRDKELVREELRGTS